jgi:hypothetical protein
MRSFRARRSFPSKSLAVLVSVKRRLRSLAYHPHATFADGIIYLPRGTSRPPTCAQTGCLYERTRSQADRADIRCALQDKRVRSLVDV